MEVPGPATWEARESRWRLCEAILLVLRVDNDPDSGVATLPPLEAYFINFQAIVGEIPEAWHLFAAAEDSCRAENFPRLARQLEAKKGQSPPQWSEVFVAW